LKPEFRKPYGELYTSVEQIRKIIKDKKIISVGDVISSELIKNNIKPDIIIFDERQNRKPVTQDIKNILNKFDAEEIQVENPKSNITEELWNAIKSSLTKNNRIKIKVDGEEDLAVLPIIVEANESTIVLYGFMGRGFILVQIDKNLKERCQNLLTKLGR